MSFLKIGSALLVLVVSVVIVLNWPQKEEEQLQPLREAPTEEVSLLLPTEVPVASEVVYEEEIEPLKQSECSLTPSSSENELPHDVDRMTSLFQPYPPLLPIVETVTYSTRAPWIEGRSAYLGDYASHFKTSKHFISRSLHGVGNYFSENVSKGDRFNIFRKDKPIEFHLVLDLSRLKLWAYYFDKEASERVLLKAYPVAVGRLDPKSRSGCLTPTGVFALGEEIAVYNQETVGTFQGEPCEMITIFGSRWIPLGREIANCSRSSKGIGLHGVPWRRNLDTGEFIEDRDCIGNYISEGCIRLLSEDIAELFSVIVSKPSYIHIVKDFHDASLPGIEKAL